MIGDNSKCWIFFILWNYSVKFSSLWIYKPHQLEIIGFNCANFQQNLPQSVEMYHFCFHSLLVAFHEHKNAVCFHKISAIWIFFSASLARELATFLMSGTGLFCQLRLGGRGWIGVDMGCVVWWIIGLINITVDTNNIINVMESQMLNYLYI